jgi:hypothetical protein
VQGFSVGCFNGTCRFYDIRGMQMFFFSFSFSSTICMLAHDIIDLKCIQVKLANILMIYVFVLRRNLLEK